MNKNKPKILYIITQGHWGGAQKYVFDLATALADDFDITVAVGEPNNLPDLQKKLLGNNKIKLIQLNFLQRNISPIKDFLALLEIRNLYKKIKPDIVHLNSTKAGILGSLATYLLSHISYLLIYTVHGWVFNEPMNNLKKKLYIFLEKLTARKKDKIIVLSEDEKNIGMNKLKISERKLEIIPVGIELPKQTLSRDEARKEILRLATLAQDDKIQNWADSYIIGTIANFYPTKNLTMLIEAINLAKDKLNNFHAIIIGDGPEREKLQLTISNKQLTNYVHLTGFIHNASQYLPAFDVFVLPSKKEGLPYTILEAKLNKVPIIATDVGAIKDIITNKKTGLLVSPENTEKMADALIYAYYNQKEMLSMTETTQNKNLFQYLKNNMILKTKDVYQKYSIKS